MESLRILTVDDEPLALRKLQIMLSQVDHIVHVGSATGCEDALDLICDVKPDIMLLDIRMGDGTGFDLLERLPDELLPIVIFVTAFDIYAARAFDVRAIDYLLKPVELSRLQTAIDRARQSIDARYSHERVRELRDVISSLRSELHARAPRRFEREFWVRRHGGGFQRVSADAIDSVTVEDDYVKIRSAGRELLMRETVTGMQARLDPSLFVRIHRSTLVRVAAVEQFRRSKVGTLEAQLHDGSRYPVGRVYAKTLRKFIAEI